MRINEKINVVLGFVVYLVIVFIFFLGVEYVFE